LFEQWYSGVAARVFQDTFPLGPSFCTAERYFSFFFYEFLGVGDPPTPSSKAEKDAPPLGLGEFGTACLPGAEQTVLRALVVFAFGFAIVGRRPLTTCSFFCFGFFENVRFFLCPACHYSTQTPDFWLFVLSERPSVWRLRGWAFFLNCDDTPLFGRFLFAI